MKEGIIELNTPAANELGFTPDKFSGYLWFTPDTNTVTISFIQSLKPRRGNVHKLMDTIISKGYRLVVPTPLRIMEIICKARKMKSFVDYNTSGDQIFGYESRPIA